MATFTSGSRRGWRCDSSALLAHTCRLRRRHRGAMGQDAGIHHQQFLLRTGFATEHDPTEAHLGIDLEQQLRQLRFADPMIECGAQLDEFRLLFLGRQGRQMQLIVDAQLTGLGGFGDGGDAGLCAFNEWLKECFAPASVMTGADSTNRVRAAISPPE